MALSPSMRATLMKEVVNRLSSDDYVNIDIALKAFKLPTANTWSGNAQSYVAEMVGDASDECIVGLAEHLGVELPTTIAMDATYVNSDNKLKIFISHLASQKQYAGTVKRNLAKYGIDSFVAHDDIEPSKEWQDEIEAALLKCDALIALLHPTFHQSKWTDQELGFVMGRSRPILAVQLGETPYGFIGKFQAFNGLGKNEEALSDELFQAFKKHSATKIIVVRTLVTLFEESGSFEASKKRIGYLEDVDQIGPELLQRVGVAAKNNSQITNSFGVLKRVNRLIVKHS
jgi:TIR domain